MDYAHSHASFRHIGGGGRVPLVRCYAKPLFAAAIVVNSLNVMCKFARRLLMKYAAPLAQIEYFVNNKEENFV